MAPASSVMTSKMEPSVMRPARNSVCRRPASSSVLLRLKKSRMPISLVGERRRRSVRAGADGGRRGGRGFDEGRRRGLLADAAVADEEVVGGAEHAVAAGQRQPVVG